MRFRRQIMLKEKNGFRRICKECRRTNGNSQLILAHIIPETSVTLTPYKTSLKISTLLTYNEHTF